MADEIRVPEVSDGITEGKVIGLAVAVGDTVEADQTLLELETDKAIVAIPAPFAGRITEIKVGEGDTVAIGAVIMLGESNGGGGAAVAEAAPEAEAPTDTPAPVSEAVVPPTEEPAPVAKQPAEASPAAAPSEADLDLSVVRSGDEVAPAAPSVRRLARELGVDIHRVPGSGPGGRISAEDLQAFVKSSMQRQDSAGGGGATASPASRPLPDFSKWGEIEREPLSRVRELTGEAMSYAWSTIPMVTQYDQADITELEDFRKSFNQRAAAEDKLTTTAILLKICAAALQAFPTFNSSLDQAARELVLKRYIHIGVAVDTPGGLLVPVIRDVDSKGIETLATELNDLAARTRDRRMDPAELEGGTFTISNLGGIGGTAFTPLVYAPQVAILGVSRATRQPVWQGDTFGPRLVMPLSLTYDHRVIDGADGARFLRWICQAIEQPINLVMKG